MDSTLFIYASHMQNFLDGCFKHCLCISLKLKDDETGIMQNIETIFNEVVKHNLTTIFFLYNCTYIEQLIDYKLDKKYNVKVIAWHQKHYFPSRIVKHLYKIMEYSIIQCKNSSRYDPLNHDKYILFPYPAIMPPETVNLSQYIKDRYANKYIFTGGNNNRNYRMVIDIAKKCPQYSFIFNLNKEACKKYIKSYIDDIPENLKIYLEVSPTEFLYAIKNAHILLLPYKKSKSTVGHSTIAQGIYYKKPIISSTNSSMDESVIDGKTGYLVDIGDSDTTIEKMKTLMEDNSLYAKMIYELEKIQYTRTKAYYLNKINEVLTS